MKSIETIKNEIKEVEAKMSMTIKLYNDGIYTEEVFKREMTYLESARNTLLWVIK